MAGAWGEADRTGGGESIGGGFWKKGQGGRRGLGDTTRCPQWEIIRRGRRGGATGGVEDLDAGTGERVRNETVSDTHCIGQRVEKIAAAQGDNSSSGTDVLDSTKTVGGEG